MYNFLWCLFAVNFALPVARGAEYKFKQYNSEKKKIEVVVAVDFDRVKVSKDCLTKRSIPCQALTAMKKRDTKKVVPVSGLLGHPAARYCQAIGATNLIFVGENRNEQDFCVFSDKSFVSSWGLFNAVH